MDGRDLSPSIILKWTPELSILCIANTIPIFIKNVLLADDYQFYGTFYLNTVYDMKNFDNMLVSNFPCKIDNDSKNSDKNNCLFYGDVSDFTLIVSDDAFVLRKNEARKLGEEASTKMLLPRSAAFEKTLFFISSSERNRLYHLVSKILLSILTQLFSFLIKPYICISTISS